MGVVIDQKSFVRVLKCCLLSQNRAFLEYPFYSGMILSFILRFDF
jgi:hypothetical protein